MASRNKKSKSDTKRARDTATKKPKPESDEDKRTTPIHFGLESMFDKSIKPQILTVDQKRSLSSQVAKQFPEEAAAMDRLNTELHGLVGKSDKQVLAWLRYENELARIARDREAKRIPNDVYMTRTGISHESVVWFVRRMTEAPYSMCVHSTDEPNHTSVKLEMNATNPLSVTLYAVELARFTFWLSTPTDNYRLDEIVRNARRARALEDELTTRVATSFEKQLLREWKTIGEAAVEVNGVKIILTVKDDASWKTLRIGV